MTKESYFLSGFAQFSKVFHTTETERNTEMAIVFAYRWGHLYANPGTYYKSPFHAYVAGLCADVRSPVSPVLA